MKTSFKCRMENNAAKSVHVKLGAGIRTGLPQILHTLSWGAHAPRVLLAAPRRNLAPVACNTPSFVRTPKPVGGAPMGTRMGACALHEPARSYACEGVGTVRETCFARRLTHLRSATTGQAPAATVHGPDTRSKGLEAPHKVQHIHVYPGANAGRCTVWGVTRSAWC